MKKIFHSNTDEEYIDIVRDVIKSGIRPRTCNLKRLPIKQYYVDIIIEQDKEAKKLDDFEKEKLAKRIRTSVSRAIDRLVELKEMAEIFDGTKNRYVSADQENLDKLFSCINFSRKDIDIISDSMFVVFVNNKDLRTATTILYAYLGDNCYTITEFNNALLIGIKYPDDNCEDPFEYDHSREKKLIQEIAKLVKNTYYDKQHKELNNISTKAIETEA